MNPFFVFYRYVEWHYTDAYKDIFYIWGNSMWFVFHFFSVPTLIRTLFAPLNRLNEDYVRGSSLEDKAGTFVVNTMVRIMGFFLRSLFIVLAFALVACLFIAGISIYILWTAAPLIVIVLLGYGLSLF